MKQAFTNGGLTGALIGLVAGPIFNMIYTSRMNQTEIYDRCVNDAFGFSYKKEAFAQLLSTAL